MTTSHRNHPLLAAMFCMVLSSCAAQTEEARGEIRLGVLAIRDSEFTTSSGVPTIRGAELAAAHINANGGVWAEGRWNDVVVVVQGHQSRPEDASIQAHRLINTDGIHALIGPQQSAYAIPVSRIAEAARLPMISPMSSHPETTLGKDYVFRLAFLDAVQGDVLGRFAATELGAVRAAMLYDEANQYGTDLANRFQDAFTTAGGAIVSSETFTSDSQEDFRPQLRRIAATRPDVIFLPNEAYADSIQISQARALGIRARFMGGDTWDLQRLTALDAADGSFVVHHWHYDTGEPASAAFIEAFQEEYGALPRTTAAMTYDAVQLVISAIRATKSLDGDLIRGHIASMSEFHGVTGRLSFDGGNDPERSAVVSELRGGQVRVHTVVHP
jgi:branched-chain amino acid transport system substrate-binding protein